jgi:hypothetical protein
MPVRTRIIGDESGFFIRVKDAYTPGGGKVHTFVMRDELLTCPGDSCSETGGCVLSLLHYWDLMAQDVVCVVYGLALLTGCVLFGNGCAFLFHIVNAMV